MLVEVAPRTRVRIGYKTQDVGYESGVIAITDGETTHVAQYRTQGPALRMLGGIHALRLALKHENADVEVVMDADSLECLNTYLATGRITVPDTLPQLLRLAAMYVEATGVTSELSIRFVAGDINLQDADMEEFQRVYDEAKAAYDFKQSREWALPADLREWVEDNNATVVYTDGSFLGETGFAAWAWWVDDKQYQVGTMAGASSVMAERAAILNAINTITGPVLVVTDAESYLPKMTRVIHGTHARIAKFLTRQLKGRDNVKVHVVSGHDICTGNVKVDRLARDAVKNGWAHICETPGLARRLEEIHLRRRVETKQRRKHSNDAWHRRHKAFTAA